MKKITVSVILFKNKILLLKRASTSKYDPGKWEFVSGFVKEDGDIRQQSQKRTLYETGLNTSFIKQGEDFEVEDEYGKWLIYPFLFSSISDKVQLRETSHTQYKWISLEELSQHDCVKDLDKNLAALKLL